MDGRMTLTDLLSPAAVISPLRANGKKQALQELAQHAATLTGLPDRELFEALLQRERLGSTGIGEGIAIPHGRMPGIDRLVGLFARTEKPIEQRLRDVLGLQIGDGTAQIMKLIIARQRLGRALAP